MKWNNSRRDPLPSDQQEVLISVNGIYYIAHYDHADGHFRVKLGPTKGEEIIFQKTEHQIYWTQLE